MPEGFTYPRWLRQQGQLVDVHCVSEYIRDDPWRRLSSVRRTARHLRIVPEHIEDASRRGLPFVRQLRVNPEFTVRGIYKKIELVQVEFRCHCNHLPCSSESIS